MDSLMTLAMLVAVTGVVRVLAVVVVAMIVGRTR
jgi:hypothetical protein